LAKTGKKIAEHFLVFYVVANLLDCSWVGGRVQESRTAAQLPRWAGKGWRRWSRHSHKPSGERRC
jgi:hypothetical protein